MAAGGYAAPAKFAEAVMEVPMGSVRVTGPGFLRFAAFLRAASAQKHTWAVLPRVRRCLVGMRMDFDVQPKLHLGS